MKNWYQNLKSKRRNRIPIHDNEFRIRRERTKKERLNKQTWEEAEKEIREYDDRKNS